MRLQGKTAIVTGGASGFGAGIIRKFVAEGAQVMIADLNTDLAEELRQEMGAHAIVATANVADNASVQAMAAQAADAWGHIDILVNNAGVTHLPAPMETVSEEDFDLVFAVNCKSVYLYRTPYCAADEGARAGQHPERCINRGRVATAKSQLVQRLQGMDEQRNQGHGRRVGAKRCAGERAQPCCR